MTALLAENIELLSLAPDGPQRLRRLVLDLAVRGLLTQPQYGDDRADDLLAQILRDREVLVAAGDLKFKALPPPKHEEIPYQVPPHWLWTRLGEITNYGTTTKADSIPDEAWLLDLEDIEKDTSRLLRRVRFIERQSLSEKNAFRTDDVLYCKLRPYLNKVLVADHDGYCTTEILPVRCHGSWAPKYFQLALKSPAFLAYVNKKSYGMKMPRLGTEDGRMAVFPLPPLAEQHRIVAKVDELMALCDRLEARQQDAEAAHARLVQSLLDSLTQARDADEFQACWQRLAGQFDVLFVTNSSLEQLSHAVLSLAISGRLTDQRSSDEPARLLQVHLETDAQAFCEANKAPRAKLDPIRAEDEPFAPPKGWSWTRLGSLFRVITDGDHQAPPQTSDGIAFLTIGNVTDGFLNFEQCRSVEERYFSGLAAYRKPAPGDLLYTVVGATYGRPVLVDSDRPFCVQRHIAILKRSEHLDAKFALYLLRSPLVYQQASASTTGTAQPTIPLKPLRNMLVPLPPLAEQRRIVAKVDELLALCDQLKARIAAARAKHAQLAQALVEQAVA